jgi:hypothetical protein
MFSNPIDSSSRVPEKLQPSRTTEPMANHFSINPHINEARRAAIHPPERQTYPRWAMGMELTVVLLPHPNLPTHENIIAR